MISCSFWSDSSMLIPYFLQCIMFMSPYYPVAARILCPHLSGHFAVANTGDVMLAGLFSIHDVERKRVESFREKVDPPGCSR